MIESQFPLSRCVVLSRETSIQHYVETTAGDTHLIVYRHLLHHNIHHRPKVRHRIRLDIPHSERIDHMNTGPQSDELHPDGLAGIRLERPVGIVSDKRPSKPQRRTQLKHYSPRERPLLLDLGRMPDALPRAFSFQFSSLLREPPQSRTSGVSLPCRPLPLRPTNLTPAHPPRTIEDENLQRKGVQGFQVFAYQGDRHQQGFRPIVLNGESSRSRHRSRREGTIRHLLSTRLHCETRA